MSKRVKKRSKISRCRRTTENQPTKTKPRGKEDRDPPRAGPSQERSGGGSPGDGERPPDPKNKSKGKGKGKNSLSFSSSRPVSRNPSPVGAATAAMSELELQAKVKQEDTQGARSPDIINVDAGNNDNGDYNDAASGKLSAEGKYDI